MSTIPVKYPLDLTGAAASNRVSDEPYTLPATNIRVLVPRYGAFFTGSVVLRDANTNRQLVRDTDYYAGLLYTLPTEQTGQEVHQILVITDSTVGTNVLLDAQMVGGEYSYSYDAIVQLVEQLGLDTRPVAFDNIIGKPATYPPSPHLHDIGDTYGWEYMASSMDRVTQAILLGSAAGAKGVYDYVDAAIAEINAAVETLQQARSSPTAIIKGLGYTPADIAGGVFTGLVTTSKQLYQTSLSRSKAKAYAAVSASTVIDTSLSNHFTLALMASTVLNFSVDQVLSKGAMDYIEFSLLVTNDATANRVLTFPTNVQWPNGTVPARGLAANAKTRYKFCTYDGGITWLGELKGVNYALPT